MQADGRFVQHVQDAHQAGADLRGQADALAFTAGQRGRGAGEIQVVEADVEQKGKAAFDFLEQALRDLRLQRRKRQGLKKIEAFADGHQTQVVDGFAADSDGQAFFLEPRAVAGLAGAQVDEPGQIVAHRLRGGFPPAALQLPDGPFEGTVGEVALVRAVEVELDRLVSRAVQKNILDFFRQFVERRIDIEAVVC